MSVNVNKKYDVLSEANYLSERILDTDFDDLMPYELQELHTRIFTFSQFLIEHPRFNTSEISEVRKMALFTSMELRGRLDWIDEVMDIQEEEDDNPRQWSPGKIFDPRFVTWDQLLHYSDS